MSDPIVCIECGATSYNIPGETPVRCATCWEKLKDRAEKAEARVTELENRVVELENSWLVDESIQPDGSLRPSVKTETENKRLRTALEWYADKENYRSYYEKNAAAMKEKGERARLALGNNNELDDYTY